MGNVTGDTPLQKPVSFPAIFLKLLTVIVHVPTKVGNHATPLHSYTSKSTLQLTQTYETLCPPHTVLAKTKG